MDRRWIPVAASLVAGLWIWWYYAARSGNYWSDFDQLWLAGRALIAGTNPYAAVPQSFRWPLYYPLPAVLVTLPLVALPLPLARAVFGGVTAGLASWAVGRHRPQALVLLLSCPFIYALDRGQWSPVILAACFVPALGAVLAVKPTVAAAAWVYRPSRVALIGAGVLALASLAVLPSWPLDWLDSLRAMRHFRSPVLLPWGFVLLLAALKWRRAEARLFLLLAIVPQTVVPYELVPLAVVPETRRETLIVALAWNIAYLIRVGLNPVPPLTYANVGPHYVPDHWGAELAFGYLPILLLILRRPNSAASGSAPPPYSR
jgi:hypothetical protein